VAFLKLRKTSECDCRRAESVRIIEHTREPRLRLAIILSKQPLSVTAKRWCRGETYRSNRQRGVEEQPCNRVVRQALISPCSYLAHGRNAPSQSHQFLAQCWTPAAGTGKHS